MTGSLISFKRELLLCTNLSTFVFSLIQWSEISIKLPLLRLADGCIFIIYLHHWFFALTLLNHQPATAIYFLACLWIPSMAPNKSQKWKIKTSWDIQHSIYYRCCFVSFVFLCFELIPSPLLFPASGVAWYFSILLHSHWFGSYLYNNKSNHCDRNKKTNQICFLFYFFFFYFIW